MFEIAETTWEIKKHLLGGCFCVLRQCVKRYLHLGRMVIRNTCMILETKINFDSLIEKKKNYRITVHASSTQDI